LLLKGFEALVKVERFDQRELFDQFDIGSGISQVLVDLADRNRLIVDIVFFFYF
jgi:hypothetical protein